MTEEDKNYRQGRSKRQHDSNEMLTMVGFTFIVFVLLGLIFYNLTISL